jgi:hypothetical protein
MASVEGEDSARCKKCKNSLIQDKKQNKFVMCDSCHDLFHLECAILAAASKKIA